MTSYTVINPATETEVATVGHLDLAATDDAVARAVVAQRHWAGVSPADKALLLRRFAEAVDGDRENLAGIEVANSGHPISQARWEAGHVRDV
ncbi:MAG: aldehyde dehydrogenase family protein, partial [Cryobacterium sp.]